MKVNVTFNQVVGGSTPRTGTNKIKGAQRCRFFLLGDLGPVSALGYFEIGLIINHGFYT